MMRFKVFKFGGASVKDAAAIENLHDILRRYPDERLVVVIGHGQDDQLSGASVACLSQCSRPG